MNSFEKKIGLIFLFFILPLLFLPKINIISFASESAGLRIDDLILLLVGIFLFWAHFQLHKQLFRIEVWLLAITFFGLISFMSNRALVSAGVLLIDAKIFYCVRLLEYFIFFYIGALAAHSLSGKKIIQALFLWNLLLMFLQKTKIAGAITTGGYADDVSGRVFGVASFPSEMGLILNLLFCYLVFDDTNKSKITNLFPSYLRSVLHQFYPYWMFALFGTFVIFTGNRISILALIISFIYKLKIDFKWRSIAPLLLIAVLTPIVAGVVYLINNTDVYERSADLLSFNNFKLFNIVWDKIDLTKNPVGNEVTASDQYDMSWWMRIHKWIYVAKVYVNNPETYLQGLGPGFAWAALDGGILRIFVEYGVIGSYFFWKFFSSIAKINTQTKWMTIVLAINMIFFDAYLAYKAMSIYLFIGGMAFETKYMEKKEAEKENKELENQLVTTS
jgi:hypothetical protein